MAVNKRRSSVSVCRIIQILQLINSIFYFISLREESYRDFFISFITLKGGKQATSKIKLQQWEVGVSYLFVCMKADIYFANIFKNRFPPCRKHVTPSFQRTIGQFCLG
jgi:hypothetical protein